MAALYFVLMLGLIGICPLVDSMRAYALLAAVVIILFIFCILLGDDVLGFLSCYSAGSVKRLSNYTTIGAIFVA